MSRSKGPRAKTTFRLHPKLVERIFVAANRRKISMNDLVTEVLAREFSVAMSRRSGRTSPTMEPVEPWREAVVLEHPGADPLPDSDVLVMGRDGATLLVQWASGKKVGDPFWVSEYRVRYAAGGPEVAVRSDFVRLALVSLHFVGISDDAEFAPGVPRTTGCWGYRIFFDDGRLKIAGSSRGPERARALDAATRASAHAGFTHYRLLAGDGDVVQLPEYPGPAAVVPPNSLNRRGQL